jgi:uncharacterized protein (DUF169 family)/NAD-dependent dihydropyrimidine dehydrogenase PreA subunit
MSFTIDQNLCVACGSCSSNCPNRAIIRKDDEFFITNMCCDCGTCIHYCPMGAIGEGKIKAELDNKKIDKALKDKLFLKKHIIAMKYADKAPQGIAIEDGPQFWCAICGDITEGEGTPVFFTAPASACGGSAMIGIGSGKFTKEQFDTVLNSIVIGEGNIYATKDLLSKGREAFPLFPKIYGGVVIGSLEHVKMPDLILFPVDSHQMCMISTAYAFDTGEIIMGYAGSAACLMSVTFPFMENKPVFAIGDYGGRNNMRLKDEEFLVCFPYRLVPGLVKNMERTVYARESNESE